MITLFMSISLEKIFSQLRPVGSNEKPINNRGWIQKETTYNKYIGWIVCKSYQGLQKIYSMDL